MFRLITTDPEILGGNPCIKGTQLSVEFLLELFATGATQQDILQSYPQLSLDAIEEALLYATESLKHDTVEKQGFPILDSLKGSVLDYLDPTEPISPNF